jgi:nitroreductase
MKPETKTDYPVHKLIAKRWSGRAYTQKPVSEATLKSLFEAARWAPSSFNEQPWRFIITRKGSEAFDKLFSTLTKFNQSWVINAPVLVLTVSKIHFSHDNSENRHYQHDLGLAMGNLLLQATELHLNVHIMAGFNPDEAEVKFNIPNEYKAMTVFTVGYLGEPEILNGDLQKGETRKRIRKPQDDFVYYSEWKNS